MVSDEIESLKLQVISTGSRSSLLKLCENSFFNYKTYRNETGETLLHIACRLGHLDIVRALIEIYHMPLNIRDEKGNSPCHSACEAGQLRVMDYFDKCPFKLSYHSRNFHGDTLLHLACKSGCVPLIRMLICDICSGGCKLNQYDKLAFNSISLQCNSSGHTPIHTACFHNHVSVVRMFFTEHFLGPSTIQSLISSLLILAHEQNNKGLISYFLAKERACSFSTNCKKRQYMHKRHGFQNNNDFSSESDITVRSDECISFDEPALFVLARRGNIDKYNEFSMLFYNMDIYGQQNSQGDTILHAASVSCNVSLVRNVFEALVPKHFKVEDLRAATNCFGFTCLHLACEYGSLELVKFFVHVGFSINEQTKEGHTPIHLSIMHDRKDIFDYLISCDGVTTINSKTKSAEETPLHIATCDERRIEYVKKIINHSQFNSANEKDLQGETPLFKACWTGCIEMVDILLSETTCSDIAVVNNNNETVMSIAMRLHNEELLDRLLCYPSIPQYEPEVSLINAVWDCDCLAFEGSTNVTTAMAKASHTCKMVEVLQTKANQYSYNFASDLNCYDKNGMTILLKACEDDNFNLFKWLLSLPGCDCDVKDKNGDTVLHISIKKKRMDFIQECFPKCNALSRNHRKNTTLHEAIECRYFDILRYILDNLDEELDGYINGAGDTILHALASVEEVTDIVRSLLDKKSIKYQLKNRDGDTSLHIACRNRNTLQNAKLLIALDYDKSSWYNTVNETPLLLAVQAGIFEEVMDKISEKLTSSIVRQDKFNDDHYGVPIEIPVLLFCICVLFRHEDFVSYGRVELDYVKKLIGNPLFRVCDSQGNTIFHYLAMCLYKCELKDIIDKIFEHYKEHLESFNKHGDSALHIAVSRGNRSDWLIKEILDHEIPHTFIDESNRKGRIIEQCLHHHGYRSRRRNLPDMAYYLIAKGAKHNLMPSDYRSHGTMPVLHIPVVGDSGVGKTTLINTLKCFTKNDVEEVRKNTPGVVPTEFTYEGLSYQFFDCGGHIEYETGHAKILNSLVQSSKSCEQEKSFVFCIMVTATEKIEKMKFQITKWLDIVREKASALDSPVRVFLICSHADCIETNEIRRNILNELTMFLSKADASPLMNKKDPIMVNCLMSNNKALDSSSLRKVIELLGTECSSLLSIPLSPASAALNCMLNQNCFISKPYQLKDVVEYVKKNQQFELDQSGHLVLTVTSEPLLTSEIPEVLAEQLEELHIKNHIILLKPTSERDDTSESFLKKWWIIPKLVQKQLLSHASSIFSSSIIQEKSKHLPLTAIAGIVPASLLKDIFDETEAKFAFDVFLAYLIDMEYCISIEADNIMKFEPKFAEGELSCYFTENLYFFPVFLKESKPGPVYKGKQSKRYFFGTTLNSKSKLSLDFLHTLLLRLTLQATQSSSSLVPTSYTNISLWKNGISWCTKEKVDILVEVQNNSKVIVLSRGEKRHITAKHTSKVLSDIKKLKEDIISRNKDIPQFEEFYLHPSPKDYKSCDESKPIPYKSLKECFKEPVDSRNLPSDPESDFEEESLLPIDPYMVLEPEIIKNLDSDKFLSTNGLDCYIKDILKSEKIEGHTISHEKLCLLLDTYSVFEGKKLVDLFNVD